LTYIVNVSNPSKPAILAIRLAVLLPFIFPRIHPLDDAPSEWNRQVRNSPDAAQATLINLTRISIFLLDYQFDKMREKP
jgi:hypothetical protein